MNTETPNSDELGDFKICETPKETVMFCVVVVIALLAYPFVLAYIGYKWCSDKLKHRKIKRF
jgi:hypothetical protein